jgi:hypothetical protein
MIGSISCAKPEKGARRQSKNASFSLNPFSPNNLEYLVSTVVAARNQATRWGLCSQANVVQGSKPIAAGRHLYPTSGTVVLQLVKDTGW